MHKIPITVNVQTHKVTLHASNDLPNDIDNGKKRCHQSTL